MGEEEVVVVELEGMTGFPAIAVSKLLVEQHLVHTSYLSFLVRHHIFRPVKGTPKSA